MKDFSSSSSLFLTPSLSLTILSRVLPCSLTSSSLFFRVLKSRFILSILWPHNQQLLSLTSAGHLQLFLSLSHSLSSSILLSLPLFLSPSGRNVLKKSFHENVMIYFAGNNELSQTWIGKLLLLHRAKCVQFSLSSLAECQEAPSGQLSCRTDTGLLLAKLTTEPVSNECCCCDDNSCMDSQLLSGARPGSGSGYSTIPEQTKKFTRNNSPNTRRTDDPPLKVDISAGRKRRVHISVRHGSVNLTSLTLSGGKCRIWILLLSVSAGGIIWRKYFWIKSANINQDKKARKTAIKVVDL